MKPPTEFSVGFSVRSSVAVTPVEVSFELVESAQAESIAASGKVQKATAEDAAVFKKSLRLLSLLAIEFEPSITPSLLLWLKLFSRIWNMGLLFESADNKKRSGKKSPF